MITGIITADEIFEKTMNHIAPLPCQEGYARELASIFAYHLKKNALIDAGISPDNLPYQGAVVVAPTGSGKTYLLRKMAEVINDELGNSVNIITIDGSSLAREGWKGPTLSQQLIAAKADAESEESFNRSVLFIDELDKMKLYHTGHDESNAMDNLLQLYNGGKVAADIKNKDAEYVDTSRFTIILGGAFEGIEEIIHNRLSPKSSIGFTTNDNNRIVDKTFLMKHITLDDLEKYGFKRELLGRIGSIIYVDPMNIEDYRCLLVAHNGSFEEKYNNLFNLGSGVNFEISEMAIESIAKKCMKLSTGARAVNPIINDVMRNAIAIVDRELSINKIILDSNGVDLYLKYEYGKRKDTIFEKYAEYNSNYIDKYYFTAISITDLADKIFNLYRISNCKVKFFEEFKAFINLSLTYLKSETRLEDFNFDSLIKMAKTTEKHNELYNSTLDILIEDVIKKPNHNHQIEQFYNEFNSYISANTSYRLENSLKNIYANMKLLYRCNNVYFKIE